MLKGIGFFDCFLSFFEGFSFVWVWDLGLGVSHSVWLGVWRLCSLVDIGFGKL